MGDEDKSCMEDEENKLYKSCMGDEENKLYISCIGDEDKPCTLLRVSYIYNPFLFSERYNSFEKEVMIWEMKTE